MGDNHRGTENLQNIQRKMTYYWAGQKVGLGFSITFIRSFWPIQYIQGKMYINDDWLLTRNNTGQKIKITTVKS